MTATLGSLKHWRWLVTALSVGCLTAPFCPAQERQPWNLVIVSIDTLRADHLGAYGYRSVTPAIDAIAKEGVVFEQAFTPVPLTLPAHTSLFTAAYPPANGVRDNGQALASSVPTLAEQMHAGGFQTAAFVSAFVLDRRFGLARGFDEYWGDFQSSRYAGADPGEIQIRGDRMEEAAADWIHRHAAQRFFAFLHFYDLHGPYQLPQPWRQRFAGRVYDGELAYVDHLIGEFWRQLTEQGLADRTMLVILADHGEGLGDHGEQNHGFLLYRSTTQIPLIVRFPDRHAAGKRVTSVARLIDVAPTVCSLLGIPIPAAFQGRSLAPAMDGNESGTPLRAYSETLYPFHNFHSAPLYALRDSRFTFIQAPRPELYDAPTDRAELHNVAASKIAMTNSLRAELDSVIGSMTHGPAAQPVSAEVLERLKSLGYVGGSISGGIPANANSLPDPKDRIALYGQFQEALKLEIKGDVRAAVARLEAIAGRDPELVMVQIEAGLALQRLHQDDRAVRHFQLALKADPQSALAHFDLGVSLGNLQQTARAEAELDLATRLEPWNSRAFAALGMSQARRGDLRAAISSFDRALAVDPEDFDALLNRGNVRFMMQEWNAGKADLDRAVAVDPKRGEAPEALGTMYFHLGQLENALKEYQEAVKLSPHAAAVHVDLGLLYARMGRRSDALAEFKEALTIDPTNRQALEGVRGLGPR